MSGSNLPRHTLVWPTAAALGRLIDECDDDAVHAALREWRDGAFPFVARRIDALAHESSTAVAVGLPLPPAHGKLRIAITLWPGEIACHRAPLALSEIAPVLPSPWRDALASLDRDARALEITLRGFGSAAWQAITCLPYLRDESDVDLTFAPSSFAQLDATLALFERWEHATQRRIDAEITFDGDRAVAWREWAGAPPTARVLAKSRKDARLVARASLVMRRVPFVQ